MAKLLSLLPYVPMFPERDHPRIMRLLEKVEGYFEKWQIQSGRTMFEDRVARAALSCLKEVGDILIRWTISTSRGRPKRNGRRRLRRPGRSNDSRHGKQRTRRSGRKP